MKTKKYYFAILFCILFNQTLLSQIGFMPYQTYITGSKASALVINDINGDSLNDIALINGWTPGALYNYTVLIYYQNNVGTLNNPIILTYPSGYNLARSIDAGDLNNDSKQDIVINQNDSIMVFFQVDEMNFNSISFYVGSSVDAVRIGDLNNDGLADITASCYNGLYLCVFYQDSLGNLNPANYPSPKSGLVRLEILDINNDSLNDLVFFSTGGYETGLFFYIQNSLHELNLPYSYNTGMTFSNGIALGYLNNDSKYDIAITAGGNYPADLGLFYQKDNSFDFNPPIILTAYDIPEPICIKDLNCDGKNEIIIAHNGWGAITFYEKDQNNNYNNYTRIGNIYGNYYMYNMDIGDLNNDGMPDIAIASDNLIIHYNDSKPIVSDTAVYANVIYNDTINYSYNSVINYVDSFPAYILITTDSVHINSIVNFIYQWEYYYGIQEGYICNNFVKDSILIDSNYVYLENIISSDTTILSHHVDTIYLDISVFAFENSIFIFPNPVTDVLNIEIKDIDSDIDISLFDILDNNFLSFKGTRNSIYLFDFSTKPKGIFFIKFKNNEQTKIIKLLHI